MSHPATIITENPFHTFVARPDVPVRFNLNRPNQMAVDNVKRFLKIIRAKKRENVLLPIIAEAGSGKTHLFHVIREVVTDAYAVYIPVPINTERIFAHIYFETVKAGGALLLEWVADYLEQTYKSVENAALEFPGMTNIVITGFFALKDPKQAKIALKWLTGFDVDSETVHFKRTIMDDEDLAFAALQLILRVIDKPIIFFIDEVESLFISQGPEAELRFLETIKKLVNEASNFLMCLACLITLWDKILDLSSTAFQGRIEPPIVLKHFTKEDINDYCQSVLPEFHVRFDISPPDPLWPLEKGDIESSYAYSHGNPREAIKWLAGIIEKRKIALLETLDTNQQYLTRIGSRVKTKIEHVIKGTVGLLHKNHGLLVPVSNEDLRILVVIPPHNTVSDLFQESFWAAVARRTTNEDYDKIISIGEEEDMEQQKTKLEYEYFTEGEFEEGLATILDVK
ncbi:MAG: hypothetical protein ACFFFG_14890 [Candidatus Thorarchaeota archaeon]